MTARTIPLKTCGEAIQWADASGGVPVLLPGPDPCVVAQEEADRLDMARVEFAYMHDHHGQVMTVPVND